MTDNAKATKVLPKVHEGAMPLLAACLAAAMVPDADGNSYGLSDDYSRRCCADVAFKLYDVFMEEINDRNSYALRWDAVSKWKIRTV